MTWLQFDRLLHDANQVGAFFGQPCVLVLRWIVELLIAEAGELLAEFLICFNEVRCATEISLLVKRAIECPPKDCF